MADVSRTIFQSIGVTYPNKDLVQAALSPTGDILALGGKQGLYAIDLDDPWGIKNNFSNKQLKGLGECATLQWSKEPTLLASGINDMIHLWKYTEGRWSVIKSFRTHRRKLSDMCWSEMDTGFFCTCAPDNLIYIWDVRSPQVDLTGVQRIKCKGLSATRLKWNRFDATKIASTHHGLVNIWDLRNVSQPVTHVLAETSEITSIDWSYKDKDSFLTASFTNKFKLWTLAKGANENVGTEITSKPIDKAYFMPFGHGVAVLFKNTGMIQLYNVQNPQSPAVVDSFGVSQGVFSQFFCRRAVVNDENQYQFVSWSVIDSRLQLLNIDQAHVKACEVSKSRLNPPDEGTKGPISMEEEFDRIQPVLGALIEKIDKLERALIVTFQTGSQTLLCIKMTFPSVYPYGAPPAFIILNNNTDTPSEKITEELVTLAEVSVCHKSRNCVEDCLKFISMKHVLSHATLLSGSAKTERHTSRTIPSAIEKKLKELGSNYTTYIVSLGDTLATIALKSNMEKTELRKINSIHHSVQLLPGRVLIVKSRPQDEPFTDSLGSPEPTTSFARMHAKSMTTNRPKYERSKLLSGLEDSQSSLINIDEIPELLPPRPIIPQDSDMDTPTLVSQNNTPKKDNFSEDYDHIFQSPIKGHSIARSLPQSLRKYRRMVSENPIFNDNLSSSLNPPEVGLQEAAEEADRADPDKITQNIEEKYDNNELAKSDDLAHITSHIFLLRSNTNRIIKGKLKYIQVPEFNYVDGAMTLTPSQFIFEPSLDDAYVKQRGVLLYTIVIELSEIVECISIKPTDGRVDYNVMSYLLIAATVGKIRPHSPHKIFYFMAEKERVRKICQTLEIWRTEKLEKELLEYLNLEGSAISERNRRIFKDAFDLLRSKFPQGEKLLPRTNEEWEEDEGLGVMLGESLLINEEDFKRIRRALPTRFRDRNWERLFSTAVDGTSLLTFYTKLYDSGPTILLINDTSGYVFGGFCSEEWKVQSGFFGTGESFVFSAKPKFACYKWTNANDFFMIATNNYIGMGGGTSGRYAIYLDSELHWGTSETSNTFLNRQLSSTEEFLCTVVEVWAFTTRNE